LKIKGERKMAKYRRILLKISGEALQSKASHEIYDKNVLAGVVKLVKAVREMDIQVALVVGGGNIWRGKLAPEIGLDKPTGDYMGMLATVMNALALQGSFMASGLKAKVFSALPINNCVEPYTRRHALEALEEGNVVVFAGGVGSPFFTTDTGAALRAREMGVDAILMGKNGVDGVFDADPRTNPGAKLIRHMTYQEMLEKNLQVMDATAVGLLEDSDIAIRVFNMADPENAIRILKGEDIGTTVKK